MDIEGKGRGVIATKEFEKDDFVVEYAGELVNITTAKQREQLYEKDERVGCYMYYFTHKNKQYWSVERFSKPDVWSPFCLVLF